MTTAKGRGKPREPTRSTRAGADANHKHTESERISEHIAAFEREGGRVEKLGTTRVLQKIDDTSPPTAAAPAASKRKR